MADISKININDSSEYNIKDTTARDGLTDRPTSFVGTRSEWNALPVATQVKYSLVDLIGEGVYKNNGTGLDKIADVGGETYTEIAYEDWLELTPQQQETGKWDVTGVPGADGTISIDLMTKLWENPNPTSSFAAQDITLSSDEYDMLLFVFKPSTSTTSRCCSEVAVKGLGATLSIAEYYSNAASNRTRYMYYRSDTVFNVSDGYINGTSNNNIIIPYQIYGIKTSKTVEIKAIAPTVSTLASKCMMSDGESVEDAISKHALGETVNITNYTSASPYTCPSDGYIRINVRSGGTLYAYIDGILMLGITSATEQNIQSVRVNKGSKIYTSNGAGNMELLFIPLQ